jgi:lysozyme
VQSRTPGDVLLIDVSENNGSVDFQAVKRAGYVGVYIKAVEGATYHDKLFQEHYKAAKAAGLPVGAYGFARPRTSSGVAEADALVAAMKSAGHFDLPPMLDMEDAGGLSKSSLAKWIHAWMDRMKVKTGRVPILYTYTAFAEEHLDTSLSVYPLWIADYRNIAAPPNVAGWTRWLLWQYTETGQIPGIPGKHFDISAFAGSLDDLRRFCGLKGVNNMLQRGDSGDAVKKLQQELNQLLHLKIKVDGVFGKQTEAAVKSFQQQKHLKVDGIVGPQTQAVLESAVKAASASAAKPAASSTSSSSSKLDQAIKLAQQLEALLKEAK